MAYLLNYTRKPISKQLYDPKLAYSMHLAVSEDGREYCALNHNSGILYAKATENEDGSLNPKSLKNPWLFPVAEGHYGVAAIRIEGDGEDDEESRGRVLLFETENLTEYREIGLLKLGTEYIERVACDYLPESDTIRIVWKERTGECFMSQIGNLGEGKLIQAPTGSEDIFEADNYAGRALAEPGIEGAVPQNAIEITAEIAGELRRNLLTPVNTGLEFSERITASNPKELNQYRAVALYSDGSSEIGRAHV